MGDMEAVEKFHRLLFHIRPRVPIHKEHSNERVNTAHNQAGVGDVASSEQAIS
jgi:hypothetical protein